MSEAKTAKTYRSKKAKVTEPAHSNLGDKQCHNIIMAKVVPIVAVRQKASDAQNVVIQCAKCATGKIRVSVIIVSGKRQL